MLTLLHPASTPEKFFGLGFCFIFFTQVGIWNYSPTMWLAVLVTERTWSCMAEVPRYLTWPAMNCAWARCHGNQLRQIDTPIGPACLSSVGGTLFLPPSPCKRIWGKALWAMAKDMLFSAMVWKWWCQGFKCTQPLLFVNSVLETYSCQASKGIGTQCLHWA